MFKDLAEAVVVRRTAAAKLHEAWRLRGNGKDTRRLEECTGSFKMQNRSSGNGLKPFGQKAAIIKARAAQLAARTKKQTIVSGYM
ncbi:hypothetical protein B1222_15135 [Paenibacillus larvae subsp. pulvifaciens]|nr:hypothetical protein BXP28_19515 [Paenibacillus larvae subsp. larvae]AQT85435.1 hypothetical protein B1222_15135 [Paenibacillus larvae subsp. pulvifaciens]MBH0344702.1 hypothetical protein [Paenibacillus larvae]